MNRLIALALVGLAIAWLISETIAGTLAIFALEVTIWYLARYLKGLADNLPKD